MDNHDWEVEVEIKHLDNKGIEDFFWQLKGGHGLGLPIGGSIFSMQTSEDGQISADMVELRGSGSGAAAILDEFLLHLTPECGEVRVIFNEVSEKQYSNLLTELSDIGIFPGIEYDPSRLAVTFRDQQINHYRECASPLCRMLESIQADNPN